MYPKILLFFYIFSHQITYTYQAEFFDQVLFRGKDVINHAAIVGVDVRQCSCKEQQSCTKEMKEQAADCFQPCWSGIREITEHPEELKNCFIKKRALLEVFLNCLENNIHACVESDSGPRIQKTNISEVFRLSERAIAHKTDSLSSIIPNSIRKIVETASNFGICLKTCFLKKNENGFCFDRNECQPLILEMKAKRTLRRCTRSINWKKEAGELCQCSVDAGLSELKEYCAVLKVIAERKESQPRH